MPDDGPTTSLTLKQNGGVKETRFVKNADLQLEFQPCRLISQGVQFDFQHPYTYYLVSSDAIETKIAAYLFKGT